MSDSLLPYYDRELNAVRRLAAEFAEAHPKIAGRLRLSADTVDDPHVARLLEGVAFLAARVHHRLDDEFPELTDALLGVLYPHYLAPMPSCAVVQFASQPDLLVPFHVERGLALETEPVKNESCRYQTAYPLVLWPVEIEAVRLSGLPLAAPANPMAAGAVAVLRITLRCAAPDTTFTQLGVDRLRFFLRGPTNVTLPLYELLCAHTLSVACADGPADPAPTLLPPGSVQPVGFAAEEALLPWPERSFSGFRLLTEYFSFPEKFLFLDITRLDAKTLLAAGNRMDVFVYLDRTLPELERSVGVETLALGCAPVVNLFAHRCEPVPLTHLDTEYRIVPDARRPAALEVWQVERVRESVKGKPRFGVFMAIYYDPVITIGRGAFLTEMIEAAGARSVTADVSQEWPQISIEAVMARNPEALLLMRGGRMTLEMLRERPGWRSLAAVKEGRVYYTDDRMDLASPVAIDALEEMARAFHP